MADAIWNAREPEHLSLFRREVLAPLIAATRPLDLRTPETVNDAARAWILCLKDVHKEILLAGVEGLLIEGPTWMPKPGDLRRVCADVIVKRRKALKGRADEITELCTMCEKPSGLAPYTDGDGVLRYKRCECRRRAAALYDGIPEPLALPPAEHEQGVD